MGLGGIVSDALIRVKADTSQAKAEFKSLRGVERQAAQERLAEMEKTNRGIDAQIAMWGKIAVGVGAGVAAYKLAQSAARAYLEDVRLESAAAGANLGALQKATLGLVEADDLLAFAGKAQAGVWKLNQSEMETVLKGATALRKTMGVELQPTIEKLTEAVAKGSTRALKEFGIEAKDKHDVLRQLSGLFSGLGGDAGMAGDKMAASGVKIADAFDDIQGELGELVMALEPAIAALATFVGLLADGIKGVDKFTDWAFGVDTQGGTGDEQRRREIGRYKDEAARLRGLSNAPGGMGAEWGRQADELERQIVMLEKVAAKKAAENLTKVIPAMANRVSADIARSLMAMNPLAGAKAKAKKRGGAGGGFELNAAEAEGFSGYGSLSELMESESLETLMGGMTGSVDDSELDGLIKEWQAGRKSKGGRKSKEQPTMLEQIFGTPAEINETAEAIKLAASAFEGLTAAAAAGFDAWITGSESFSASFTKAIAEAMRALAGQMFVESLKHAAFAIGSLAFGNLPGAATHAKAAAAFGAGALAAGVVAREMGQATGQWSKSGGAGASAGGGGGASSGGYRSIGNNAGGGQSNAPITIYVGAEWAAMSKIEQASALNNAIRAGKRGRNHIRRS